MPSLKDHREMSRWTGALIACASAYGQGAPGQKEMIGGDVAGDLWGQPPDRFDSPLSSYLAGALPGLYAGYASHLALDFRTTRCLPLIG